MTSPYRLRSDYRRVRYKWKRGLDQDPNGSGLVRITLVNVKATLFLPLLKWAQEIAKFLRGGGAMMTNALRSDSVRV